MFRLLTLLSFTALIQITTGDWSANGYYEGVPDLPWGDINLLVVTDDHSWVGGHGRKEPYLNADFGEILSFYQHLKAYCEQQSKDLFFVMNGDWIDGTGLSLDGDISNLVPLIQKMPFDVVNTGNHELYKSNVIQSMRQPGGFVDWWGRRHLASNTVMSDTKEPLSNRYMILEGGNSRVLVFGFIYHLVDPAEEVVVNNPANETKEAWFQEALQSSEYDAILVMAHMGVDDESVGVILDAIRSVIGNDMPIQFVAGHTHLRRWAQLDVLSTAVESGRYLDTAGFISFPSKLTVETKLPETSSELFQHVFVDTNVNMMKYTLNSSFGFGTPDGEELQKFILRTQQELDLLEIIGCAPADFYMNRSMEESDSLWGVYRDRVVPSQLEQGSDSNRVIIVSQYSWRYDLFEGENAYDDVVAVSPFNEPVYFVGVVPCQAVGDLNEKLNGDATELYYESLPAYIMAGTAVRGEDCELYTHQFELQNILDEIQKILPGSYQVSTTNMTSTSIWVYFFLKEWPCTGQTGIHIPWFDDHKIVNENGETSKKNLAIAIGASASGIIIFCCLIAGACCVLKHMCTGKQAITEEEMDSFKEDREVEAEFA